jgi:N-acetylglucosamine kinase-like BadF-type ATPase
VAGALSPTVREWLRATLAVLLPNVPLTVTHDLEIALVGAHSERRGILVLAGTGSAIYGDNGWGKTKLAGGWGYLLGDEGGGYWIGLQAMKAVAQSADDESPNPTVLKQIVFDALGITDARQMVSWLYGQPRIKEVAALAPLVLAAEGDRAADSIITLGAMRLAIATRAVKKQLGWHVGMPLSFAGGILMTKNALSRALCVYLYLPEIPLPKHSPVMGAVILALDSIGLKPNAD